MVAKVSCQGKVPSSKKEICVIVPLFVRKMRLIFPLFD